MPSKAPSEGQKVDLGRDAPITREGAGVVPSESLAAESRHSGGGFAENVNNRTEHFSTSKLHNQSLASNISSISTEEVPARSAGAQEANGGAAPSYIENQYIRDPSGPHGKAHLGGDDEYNHPDAEDGIQKALDSELGSKGDPSRLAEQQFEMKQAAAPGAMGSGEVGAAADNSKYDVLKETSA